MMQYHNDSFGSGYSTIEIESNFTANEISFSNAEYGYYLCIEHANILDTIIDKLIRIRSDNYFKSEYLYITDDFGLSVSYEDGQYLIHTNHEIESYNHICLNLDEMSMFIDKLSEIIKLF